MGIYGYPGSDSLGRTDIIQSDPKSTKICLLQRLAQDMTALCYQSQISKFLKKNRRNPNLKQDSESSSQLGSGYGVLEKAANNGWVLATVKVKDLTGSKPIGDKWEWGGFTFHRAG